MQFTHTVGNETAIIDVKETEKNPKLVPLQGKKYLQAPCCEQFMLRRKVANKLAIAASMLPDGYQFKIFETYRTAQKQIALWNNELAKIKAQNPHISQTELEEKANIGIANQYKIGSGHQTGAAFDLTLCKDGQELDMGTPYLDTNNPKTPTFSKGLTLDQMQNRSLLFFLMTIAGLSNYPLEWWHYSYGEQEWAVITHHQHTLYAKINFRE